MRVIFYTFLTILGISLSAIILMPSLFDINNYKEKIESLVLNKTNNTLKIAGDISISLLSGLRLSVKDISYIANNGENLFKSKELLISPQFFQLLKGELVFNSIKVVNPTIYIIKKKDEKNNWETAFKKNKKEEIKKELNKGTENNNKNNQRRLNPLGINSLSVVDAVILSNIKGKKNKFENINMSLTYKNNNIYFIGGNIFYKKEKINFSYDLEYLEKNLQIKGFIKGKDLEVNNNTNIDTTTLRGISTIYVTVNKLSRFVDKNYLQDQSLKLNSSLSFTDKSIKFSSGEIINKKNLINFKGDLIKKDKKNIFKINLNTNILDANNLVFFDTTNKNPSEVKDKSNKGKSSNMQEQDHIVDSIFAKLNNHNIEVNFFAKEIMYKKHNIKNVKVKLLKQKKIDVEVSLNNKLIQKLAVKAVINKKKFSTFEMNADNLDLKKVNDYIGYNKLSGLLNFSIEGNTSFNSKNSMLNKLNGKLIINTKNMKINDLNLKALKSNILRIENIDNLLELNKKVFKGDTNINNQEIFIEIKNGNLRLPETDILLDDNNIKATGFYELLPNNINMNLNYDDKKNKLLSLFKINVKGNIKNIETSLDYDKAKTEQFIGDMVEKKMKKVIKDKLDNKFNDIIENLLD